MVFFGFILSYSYSFYPVGARSDSCARARGPELHLSLPDAAAEAMSDFARRESAAEAPPEPCDLN